MVEIMSDLTLVLYPNSILRKPSTEVDKSFDVNSQLILKMKEILNTEDGMGIAAPQIGVHLRVFLIKLLPERKDCTIFINPQILEHDEIVESEEACLSVPGFVGVVNRSKRILVSYTNSDGKICETSLSGLNSVCFQHELDHLNGVLFIDRISEFQKNKLKKYINYLKLNKNK
jgi:peptide deformylase